VVFGFARGDTRSKGVRRFMSFSLKDIARMAEVSTATVSRVLNNKAVGNMRIETYNRVMRIIEKTGYTPHALASGLRTGLSKVIGVILPSNVNPYYAQLGQAIEDEAFRNGYLTLVCNSNSVPQREKEYIRHLTGQRVYGILLCSTGLEGSDIRSLVPETIKVILLDEELEDYTGAVVIGNDFAGGYMGARYLHSLGHDKIVVVTGPKSLSSTSARLHGLMRCCEEDDLPFDLSMIRYGDYTLASALGEVRAVLELGIEFTAVFTFNDLMAIGSMRALSEKGIRVPDDVSVLGYDNIFIDDLVCPGITTVATPLEELGKCAVRKLLDPDGETDGERYTQLLEPRLVVRESCKKRE
jgi:LacI family transcriptional regulator